VSSLPSPQESSSFAGPEYLSNGDSHMYNSDRIRQSRHASARQGPIPMHQRQGIHLPPESPSLTLALASTAH
jgi:hypothetical protein